MITHLTTGHCAQYCTYTTMENDSKEIISVVTVDKRQTNRSSVIMEKHAFIKTFDGLTKDLKTELQCCILRKRMDGGGLPRKAKDWPEEPRHLDNSAGVVPPSTAELVQTQIHRGQVCQRATSYTFTSSILTRV